MDELLPESACSNVLLHQPEHRRAGNFSQQRWRNGRWRITTQLAHHPKGGTVGRSLRASGTQQAAGDGTHRHDHARRTGLQLSPGRIRRKPAFIIQLRAPEA